MRKIIIGSAIASKTTVVIASPMQMPLTNKFVWQDLRREIEPERVISNLPLALQSLLERADSNTNLEEIFKLSYVMASGDQIPILDRFWIDHMARQGDVGAFQAFLQLRTKSINEGPANSETYLQNWLYKATEGGHYDNGG